MTTMLKRFASIVSMGSNVRCKVCGGWGGEWGEAKGVGPMCYDCYKKRYGYTTKWH